MKTRGADGRWSAVCSPSGREAEPRSQRFMHRKTPAENSARKKAARRPFIAYSSIYIVYTCTM